MSIAKNLLLENRINLPPQTVEAFFQKFERAEDDQCWLWFGSKNGGGYGILSIGDKTRNAHRLAYEMAFGALSRRFHVHHLCNQKACINPLHLQALRAEKHAEIGALEKLNGMCSKGHPLPVGADGWRLRICEICNTKQAPRIGALPRHGIEFTVRDLRVGQCCGLKIHDDCTIPNRTIRRFESRVKVGTGKECWTWLGDFRHNYGRIWNIDRSEPAHRVSYAIFRGGGLEGLHVHHVCENRACVNPDHLKLVTAREHAVDLQPNSITSKQRERAFCIRGHELGPWDGRRRKCKICTAERAKGKRHEFRAVNPLPEQTHCKNGHPLSGDNVYSYQGKRICRTCRDARMAAHKKMRLENPDYTPSPMGPERTHCRRGHELTEGNVYLYRGVKMCRECRNLNHLDYQARKP